MNLKILNQINRDKTFSSQRLSHIRQLVFILNIAIFVFLFIWVILDKNNLVQDGIKSPLVRQFMLILFTLNIIGSYFRKTPVANKQHLVATFYLANTFFMLLAMFTGASQSPYWGGLIFNLIAWYLLVPLSYRELIIHSFVFVVMFISGMFAQTEFPVIGYHLANKLFACSGIMIVGIYGAYIRNVKEAHSFQTEFDITQKNAELESINEELRCEMESHQQTSEQLKAREQFIESIISNAPIVLWSFDPQGVFTYSHGNALNQLDIKSNANVGKSIFDVYKGTQVEEYIRKVLRGEKYSEIVRIGGMTFNARVTPSYNDEGLITGYIGVAMDITEQEIRRKNLERFKMALDQAPAAVYIINNDMKFEYINPAFTQQSGYTAEDTLNKYIFESIYKGRIPESRQHIADALSRGETWQGELESHHKEGKIYWATTVASPYKDVNGKVDGYIIIQQDITDKKSMELALKESEALYRTLMECSTEGIALTQNSTILLANPKFIEMIGYTLEELKQIDPTAILAPEDKDRVLDLHYRRMSGEIEKSISYSSGFVRKDGSRFTAELGASTITIHGKNASYITMRDITERELLKKELEQSVQRFRDLAEMLPQTVYELDNQGRITFMNQAGINAFGKILPSEFHTASNFIIKEDHERLKVNIKKSFETKNYTKGNEYTALRADGSRYPIIVYSSPIFNNGEVIGSRGIIIDISERKAMENALLESEMKYRSVVEQALDGINITQDRKLVFANQAFCNILEYSMDEVIGTPVMQAVGEEGLDEMNDLFRRIESGEKFTHYTQWKAIAKSGKIKNVELNISVIDYKGRPAFLVITRDITERLKLQQAMRESEAKYKALVENSQNGITIVRDNKYLFANQTFCNMLGYSPEELNEIPAHMTIHPDDRAKALEQGERRRNLDFSPINVVYRMLTKSGDVRECETTSTLVEYGGIWASFFTINDITPRKEIEKALLESEAKYKTLVENSLDGIFALNGDAMLFVNNTFCRMMGYTPEEFYQLNPYQLIDESDHSKARNIKLLRNQGDNRTMSEIFMYKTKDGRLIEGETFSSVVEMNGQQVSYITVHDLTETRKMQEKLMQSEKKYRALIDKATDGILITQDGFFKFLNPAFCEMMQYAEEELINRPFIEVVDKNHYAEMLENHKRRMSGESFPAIYRARLYRKDGSTIMVELNSRTTDFGGKPASFVITRDITDRIQAEEELLKAKTELEQLNQSLEARVKESSESLAEARTQLINLQKENLQSQFDVLRQQVNPHFLFNSLNVLTSLIKLEPDLAEQFSEHLSKVYRYVLENKDNELVTLQTELNFLDAYVFMLNIRFVDKLKVMIEIPERYNQSLIIPLAMQLLIENAIKHNTMSKNNPLRISIFVDANEYLNIVNNLQERPSQLVSTGVGLKNIENRYILLRNIKPEFIKTETHFTAKVPLIIEFK